MRSRTVASLSAWALALTLLGVGAPARGEPLVPYDPGSIAGTVVDATTGEPISGVIVEVQPVGRPTYSASGQWPGSGWSDENGDYRINNIPPGTYKLRFDTVGAGPVTSTSPYASTWYPDAQFVESAGLIEVNDATTTTVNGELALAGLISGWIADTPEWSASVSAFAYNDATDRWVKQATDTLRNGETFTLRGLRGGVEYRLWAQVSRPTPDLAQYWSNYFGDATSLDTAPGITVEAGEHLDAVGINGSQHPFIPTRRLAGANRFETSALVSAEFESADIAFIASGQNFPDALSAAPVAAKLGGPVLLTRPDSLDPSVIDELERLEPSTVVIVGSEASVSAAVADQVRDLLGIVPERVAGENRYATSRALAKYGFPDYVSQVYVTTGRKFPDALSAGAIAGSGEFPIILVDGEAASADPATRTAIQELGAKDLYVLGMPDSVSSGVFSSLATMSAPRPTVNRAGWGNRYLTSLYLSMRHYFQTPSQKVYLAVGTDYPDALSGAALAGAQDAPLLILRGDCLSLQTLEFIYGLGATEVVLLGGPTRLSPAIGSLTTCEA